MFARQKFERYCFPALIFAVALLLFAGCVDDPGPQTFDDESTAARHDLISRFDENTPGHPDFEPMAAANAHPPITEIPLVSAAEASDQIAADDLVLGVTINGKSRAYPIDQLCGPEREIINDELGGKSIAATW